jgi:hypothetical protein
VESRGSTAAQINKKTLPRTREETMTNAYGGKRPRKPLDSLSPVQGRGGQRGGGYGGGAVSVQDKTSGTGGRGASILCWKHAVQDAKQTLHSTLAGSAVPGVLHPR